MAGTGGLSGGPRRPISGFERYSLAATLHPKMIPSRPPAKPAPAPDDAWQQTRPSPLQPATPRVQPPLKEVFKGLDSRELEGQTVFDQLFGPLPGA